MTKNKRYLRKHVRWHFTSKAGAGHWCTICNYNARFPSVLRFHMKNVHKINMDEPGSEKMASFKSVVMKRKYKNMKLPGDGGADKMTVSTYVTPEPDGPYQDDSSSLEEGEMHPVAVRGGRGRGRGGRGRSSVDQYRGQPSAAALTNAANAAAAAVASAVAAATTTPNSPAGMQLDPPGMLRPSCSQAPYARSTSSATSTAPTLSMPGMAGDMSLHNSGVGGHLQPHPAHHHHHHHHHQQDHDLGLSNLMPAHQHRPILPPGPSSIPSSSVLNPALQASEYLYNPQAFGGFLTPQGLPPQYY